MSNALAIRPKDLVVSGPIGSLDAYIQAVSAIPVLSLEEEQALAIRFRDDEDLEAARSLVLSHLRFVVHIARGYSGYGLNLGDLVQEGNVGLMKAVKRFDPTMGVRLVSFAVHWIRAEIHEYVLRNWRLVKVATTKAQRKLFFNLRKAKKNLSWLNQEETEAVARELGVTPGQVTEMENRMSARDMTFDAPTNEGEDGAAYGAANFLPAANADPAQIVEAEDWEQTTQRRLMAGLNTLDERSRDIIKRRWMADEKETLQDLAGEYGVSAERIRQIENNAIKALRQQIAS